MMSHVLGVQISKWARDWTLGWLAVICLSIIFSVPSGIVVVLACIQAAGALVALVWYLVAAHKARSHAKKSLQDINGNTVGTVSLKEDK